MYLNVNFQRNKRICIYLFILTIIGCVIPAQAVPEGWSDPVPIPSYSSIAVDSQGKWHALYTTREQTSDMDYIVRLWYRNATGYNEELDSLTSYSDHFSPFNNLEIDIDQYGGVHVFYFDDISDTSLYKNNINGLWSDPVSLPRYSSIAVDSQGKWHALYTTREQTSDMDYIVRLWYRNATGYNEELDSLTSYSDHFSPF